MWETIKIPGLCKKDGRKLHVRYIAHVKRKRRKIASNYKQTEKNQEDGGSTQLQYIVKKYPQKTNQGKRQCPCTIPTGFTQWPSSKAAWSHWNPQGVLEDASLVNSTWKPCVLLLFARALLSPTCHKDGFLGWQRWGGKKGLSFFWGGGHLFPRRLIAKTAGLKEDWYNYGATLWQMWYTSQQNNIGTWNLMIGNRKFWIYIYKYTYILYRHWCKHIYI